jgi:hypothetical protein
VASGGIAFDALGAGTTVVSASNAELIATAAAARTVTVSAPGINAAASTTVGSGMQRGVSGNLGESNHGGVEVTITSSNPGVLLVSPDANTPGTASITKTLNNGNTGFSYHVQGVEGITAPSTVTVTVTAPGFTDGTTTHTVAQGAFEILFLDLSTNSLAGDDPFQVRVGLQSGSALGVELALRAGGTALDFEVTNSEALVGQLVTLAGAAQSGTVTVGPLQSRSPGTVASGGIAFDALGAGTTVVSASNAELIATAAAARTVTVSDGGGG